MKKILIILAMLLAIPIVNAFGYDYIGYTRTSNVSLNNVNSSEYWDNLDSPLATWTEVCYNESYVNKAGDTMTGTLVIQGDLDVTQSGTNIELGVGASATDNQGNVAIGYSASATGIDSIAMGTYSDATKTYSLSFGNWCDSLAWGGICIGFGNDVLGQYSSAMGAYQNVSGNYSFGIGLGNDARTITDNNTFAITGGFSCINCTSSTGSALKVGGDINVTGKYYGDGSALSGLPESTYNATYHTWSHNETENLINMSLYLKNTGDILDSGNLIGNSSWGGFLLQNGNGSADKPVYSFRNYATYGIYMDKETQQLRIMTSGADVIRMSYNGTIIMSPLGAGAHYQPVEIGANLTLRSDLDLRDDAEIDGDLRVRGDIYHDMVYNHTAECSCSGGSSYNESYMLNTGDNVTGDYQFRTTATAGNAFHIDGSSVTSGNVFDIEVDQGNLSGKVIHMARDGTDIFTMNEWGQPIFASHVTTYGYLHTGQYFRLKERASAPSASATFGYLWVNASTPNKLIFTDDAGTDHQLY